MNYQTIRKNFQRGLWSEAQVRTAKRKGVLTDAQVTAILASRQGAETFSQGTEWQSGITYLPGDTVPGYLCVALCAGREPGSHPEYWEAV